MLESLYAVECLATKRKGEVKELEEQVIYLGRFLDTRKMKRARGKTNKTLYVGTNRLSNTNYQATKYSVLLQLSPNESRKINKENV